MHGVRRGQVFSDKQRKEAIEKCRRFKELTEKLLAKRACAALDSECLGLTTDVLSENAEYYTAWNIRREIIEVHHQAVVECPKESSAAVAADSKEKKEDQEGESKKEEKGEKSAATVESELESRKKKLHKLLEGELSFTAKLIRVYPKSYWLWFHRQWVTDKLDIWLQSCNWKYELELCTMFLKADNRNFHCWNYRRFVSARECTPDKDEFDYTTTKIMEHFSNYSAWHQRSALLPRIWTNEKEFLAKILEEIAFVKNAFYTDTLDSSPWFYYRWLLSKLDSSGRLADEIETCEELMSEEMELTPLESKWPTLTLLRIVLKLKNSKLSEKAAAHDVEDLLKKLQEFDPDRKNYYASVNIT